MKLTIELTGVPSSYFHFCKRRRVEKNMPSTRLQRIAAIKKFLDEGAPEPVAVGSLRAATMIEGDVTDEIWNQLIKAAVKFEAEMEEEENQS